MIESKNDTSKNLEKALQVLQRKRQIRKCREIFGIFL
mgnify:CR=1 FL=1